MFDMSKIGRNFLGLE